MPVSVMGTGCGYHRIKYLPWMTIIVAIEKRPPE